MDLACGHRAGCRRGGGPRRWPRARGGAGHGGRMPRRQSSSPTERPFLREGHPAMRRNRPEGHILGSPFPCTGSRPRARSSSAGRPARCSSRLGVCILHLAMRVRSSFDLSRTRGRPGAGTPETIGPGRVSRRGLVGAAAIASLISVAACSSSSTSVTSPTSARCPVDLALSPTTIEAAGGSGQIAITVNRDCTWDARSEADWIALVAPTSGPGRGEPRVYGVAQRPSLGSTWRGGRERTACRGCAVGGALPIRLERGRRKRRR